MPGYDCVTAQHSWQRTKIKPVTIKTGFRPLISEYGARTMEATAKLAVKGADTDQDGYIADVPFFTHLGCTWTVCPCCKSSCSGANAG